MAGSIDDKKGQSNDNSENDENKNDNRNNEARGHGTTPINLTIAERLVQKTSSGGFWAYTFIILIIFLILYFTPAKEFLVQKVFNNLATLIGILIAIGLFFFALYGISTSFRDKDPTKFWVGIAILIWILDLVPNTSWWNFGNPFVGFNIPFESLSQAIPILISSIFASGLVFSFLYVSMILDIFKREYIDIVLAFIFILITNYIGVNYLPSTWSFELPYIAVMVVLGLVIIAGIIFYSGAKKNDGKLSTAIPNFFTKLYMIFVLSFFAIVPGWMVYWRAMLHASFIVIFGFFYMSKREENKAIFHVLFPTFLILDFFGYGFLWQSDVLWLKFIPVLVFFTIAYCYMKTESTYAAAAFAIIMTFIVILSIQVYGYGTGLPALTPKEGSQGEGLLSVFTSKAIDFFTKQVDLATGGLYRSQVEKNQYEPLGVYFTNVKASQPKFYSDEQITVWATLKSKTLSDPVTVNFTCYRWRNGERFKAQTDDPIVPKNPFIVFTYEEKDVECTFAPNKLDAGTNIVTLAATYNFDTSGYKKTYFIDKEKLRAMTRENLDPLKEFGITDRDPALVHTNGPVEIAMDMKSLVSVGDDASSYPNIGIMLRNREKITDKSGKPYGEWKGKIKKINELTVIVPNGVEIDANNCRPIPFIKITNVETHCSSACNSVANIGYESCTSACGPLPSEDGRLTQEQSNCFDNCNALLNSKERDETFARCNDNCQSLFKPDPNGPAYAGYTLDISQLKNKDDYKDIDRYRTFGCRLIPSTAILDNTPITTKFIRVRARYDYLLESSYNVFVETAKIPVEDKGIIGKDAYDKITEETLSKIYFSTSNRNEMGYSPVVLKKAKEFGIDYLLVKALIQTENTGWDPKAIGDKGRTQKSYGLMQINEGSVVSGCMSGWKDDVEANINCGLKVLQSKYTLFRQICGADSDCRHLSGNYCQGRKCLSMCKDKTCEYEFTGGSTSRYYSGWLAAIRAYNGWGSGGNDNYVEDVMARYNTLREQVKNPPQNTPQPVSETSPLPVEASADGTSQVIGVTQ